MMPSFAMLLANSMSKHMHIEVLKRGDFVWKN